MDSTRVQSGSLTQAPRIHILSVSTPDHQRIVIEHLLQKNSRPRITLFTYDGGVTASEEYTRFLTDHQVLVKICAPNTSETLDADITLFLYSHLGKSKPQEAAALRKAFGRTSGNKIIIDGDGSLWSGKFGSRMVRRVLRPVLNVLRPMRDSREIQIWSKRLMPDPGYHPGEPPAFIYTEQSAPRRVIMKTPLRIEQCTITGNVLKTDLLRNGVDPNIYEDGYHTTDLVDHQRDWDRMLREYQALRWRNMTKVGVQPAAESGLQFARALDVGCGTGGLAAKLADEGYKVLGVDCARASIDKARSIFPQAEFRIIPFEQIGSIPERFDLITLSHVVEHARDDVSLLKAVTQLLNPNGRIFVEVPWLQPGPLLARPHWCINTYNPSLVYSR